MISSVFVSDFILFFLLSLSLFLDTIVFRRIMIFMLVVSMKLRTCTDSQISLYSDDDFNLLVL